MPHRCIYKQATVDDDLFDRALQLVRVEPCLEVAFRANSVVALPENTVHHADVDIDAAVNVHFKTAKHHSNEAARKVSRD